MAGTILMTGANSSLAIPAVQRLLAQYPDHTAVLAVRNASDNDVNTNRLRDVIAQFPDAKTSIRELDLSGLSAVHEFASTLAAEIVDGKLPPFSAVVCNAYYWNLAGEVEFTKDGYEKTFEVNHLAHAALILRLLNNFGPGGGRVVLLASDAHWTGKNSLEVYPPGIPDDLDLLVKPVPPLNKPTNHFAHGFNLYANSKLAVIMWMYALNRHLQKDPSLSKITAVAINPGNLSDSRALRTNTPQKLVYMSKFIIRPLRPLLSLMDPTMRTAAEAGADVVDLAMNKASPGERGYFTLLKKDTSSPDSLDENKQESLWAKSLEWAKITKENTSLQELHQ